MLRITGVVTHEMSGLPSQNLIALVLQAPSEHYGPCGDERKLILESIEQSAQHGRCV